MIYTVTLNPAVDRELLVDKITFDTVLRASKWRVDCGGKGFNVARMLQSLGTSSVALGFAAGKTGELLNDELKSLGIETGFVWVDGETRTNVSIVSADRSHYVKVNEPGPTISGDDLVKLMQKVQELARPGDGWVLAGSLPPGVPPSIYSDMTTILQSAGVRVFLDASGEALRLACRPWSRCLLTRSSLERICLIRIASRRRSVSSWVSPGPLRPIPPFCRSR